MWLATERSNHCSSTEGGPRMRTRMLVLGCLVAALAATGLVGGTAARADEEAKAPPDPTRGQWDSFLDPLRDFEDNYVTASQKARSEEHTSELQSLAYLVCRLLLEKK